MIVAVSGKQTGNYTLKVLRKSHGYFDYLYPKVEEFTIGFHIERITVNNMPIEAVELLPFGKSRLVIEGLNFGFDAKKINVVINKTMTVDIDFINNTMIIGTLKNLYDFVNLPRKFDRQQSRVELLSVEVVEGLNLAADCKAVSCNLKVRNDYNHSQLRTLALGSSQLTARSSDLTINVQGGFGGAEVNALTETAKIVFENVETG